MELVQMVPLLMLAGFLGHCIGYGMGRRVTAERAISQAPEYDLLKEVKRRRARERIEDEVDKEVEREAGPRSVSF